MMAAIEQGAPLMTVGMSLNFLRIRLGAWPSTNLNHEVCPAAHRAVVANSRVRSAPRGRFFRGGREQTGDGSLFFAPFLTGGRDLYE